MGLQRVQQAGAQLSSVCQVMCELQRDRARKATVRGMIEIAKEHLGTFGIQLILEKEHPMPPPDEPGFVMFEPYACNWKEIVQGRDPGQAR